VRLEYSASQLRRTISNGFQCVLALQSHRFCAIMLKIEADFVDQ